MSLSTVSHKILRAVPGWSDSRRSASAVSSRPGQLADARADRAANARPRRSASAVSSRPGQLAGARADRAANARPRRWLRWDLPGLAAGKTAGLSRPVTHRRLTPRLCRTMSRVRAAGFAGTFPPLRDARRRLVPSGHGLIGSGRSNPARRGTSCAAPGASPEARPPRRGGRSGGTRRR